MNYYEDRWYHGYLYLMTVTCILSICAAFMTEWTSTPFILIFGLMAAFSAICFFAESAVMGTTAKAGSLFWTAITCFCVAHFLPWPHVV